MDEARENIRRIEERGEHDMLYGDFDWLIEQAERVQKLEEIKIDVIKQIDVTQRRNERLEERVQELEEELKIYKTIAKNNKHAGETLLHEVSKENRKLIKENKFLNERRLHHKKRNKRYREVVTQAISDLENECLWDALVKLKALEVED